ncbi:MAG: AMP-binding protein [Candidatus Lokiarchaeota archaeon]|nr:AMP-binding protein [Candidatus Lokiarchaeota archaeon]
MIISNNKNKHTVESKISVRRSGGKKGYDSAWIYIPTRVYSDSSFPFKKEDKLVLEIEDDQILVRKKRIFDDIINNYGIENATLPKLIENKAIENKDLPAILYEDEIYSYNQVNDLSNQIAHGIIKLIKQYKLKNKHIAIMIQNNPYFVWSFIGVAKAGAISVPINYFLRGESLLYILTQSDSEAIFIDYKFLHLFEEIEHFLSQIKFVVVINAPKDFKTNEKYLLFEEINTSNKKNPEVGVKFTDVLEIIFTEGTTGKPKAVCYKHQKILTGLIYAEESKLFKRSIKNIYGSPPLFHYFPQLIIFLQIIFLNSSIVLTEDVQPKNFWQEASKYGSNAMVYHGGTFPSLINQPPSEIERSHGIKWAIGGEVPKDLWEICENRFGITLLEGWSSTEAMGYTMNNLGTKGGKVGSIGKPIEEFQVKIVDIEGNELEPGPDNIGEIITRTTLPIKLNYYKPPENTAMFPRGNGFIHTGDIGYMDKDGFLYLVGRKVDIVQRKGKIIPIHVIENIAKAHPLVMDSAVVGVPVSSGSNQELKIHVVFKENETLSHEAFHNYLKLHLAHYMVPRYLEFKDRLRILTGRIKKYLLRQEWEDESVRARTWDSYTRSFVV